MPIDDSIARLPLYELGLSARAYNCLRRAGVGTIGELLAILPQGPSAVRSAGTKTWAEIESALTDFLASCGIDLSAMLTETLQEPEVDSYSPVQPSFKELIESLCLPTDVIDDLRNKGTVTVEAFAYLPLCQVISIEGLTGLTEEDWSGLTRAINARGHVRLQPTIPLQENLTPGPSLLSLVLSKRSFNCLLRAEIDNVAKLSQLTLAELIGLHHFGVKSLVEVLTKLRIYIDSNKGSTGESPLLSPQIETCVNGELKASDQMEQKTKPPEREAEMTETSLAKLVNDWLAPLSECHRNVLHWRYGLDNGQPETLEEVGERLGLTRERVRQIEARAIRRLDHPVRRRGVHRLVEYLRETLAQTGGLATEVQLGEALTAIFDAGNINAQGVALLLLDTHGIFTKVRGMSVWGLADLPFNLITAINRQMVGILASAHAPLSEAELLNSFKSTDWYQVHAGELTDEFVLACVRINDKIVCCNNGCYGLENWGRHYQDDIILAIRRLGKPAHYTEIAEAVNAILPPDQHITPRATHIRLMQHPDIFVWVGRRGTYGLREWGLERAPSYEDALLRILEDAGHPLTFEQILAQLPKFRPYYDETSVFLTISTNQQFRTFPSNTYGLAEWCEEDFATDVYRVQRLFEVGDKVKCQGTKWEVFEAMHSVSRFIAQIREKTSYES